jgi:acyl carrier protein
MKDDDRAVNDWLMTLFKEKLEIDVPSADTDLVESGLISSLTFVELLFHLEKELGVAIAMDTLELEYFRSIVSIAEFIERMRNGRLTDRIQREVPAHKAEVSMDGSRRTPRTEPGFLP